MKKFIIQVKNVQKIYNDGKSKLIVLKDINLKVSRGEFICIKGTSGAGKSTLLHLLGGLDKCTNGDILIENQNIQKMKKKSVEKFRSIHIGFIFQKHYLLTDLTALENVMLPLMLSKIKISTAKEKAKNTLRDIGLIEKLHYKPNKLSGGESQRVAIARSIVHNPSILLADEPTGNLDKENTEIFFSILKKIQKNNQQTIIMATHEENIPNIDSQNYKLENGLLNTI